MVSDELPLVRGSARRNLRYAAPDLSEDELLKRLKEAGLLKFVGALPKGLRTQLEPGGTNLSSGQRRLLALGRALVARPRLLLLDQATSGVNRAAIRLIWRALDGFPGAVVFATSRASDLLHADTVWVLRAGRIELQASAADYLAALALRERVRAEPRCRRRHRGGDRMITSPQPGQITLQRFASEPDVACFVYRPRSLDPTARPLVSIHGISRNAGSHALAFAGVAERMGALLLAPLFGDRCGRYQRLSDPAAPVDAGAALDRLLAELRATFGLVAPDIDLFGFSGGAQFAHRYALLRPRGVGGLAICAAGWYTDLHYPREFPYGLHARKHDGATPDLAGFLEIPLLVLVGDLDVKRDRTVRDAEWLNEIQGRTRCDRARRWTEATRRAADLRGVPRRCELRVLPGVGHSFDEAVLAGLPALVEEHFLAARFWRGFAAPVMGASTL
jgi:energy-coupling factor transporter ATP-binding protein EcfA2